MAEDDADRRAREVANGDGWMREDYVWDGENEYPERTPDTDALARLVADAIRAAVAAERERAARVAETLPFADHQMNDGRSADIAAAIREGKE
jgi:hypothetical protein